MLIENFDKKNNEIEKEFLICHSNDNVHWELQFILRNDICWLDHAQTNYSKKKIWPQRQHSLLLNK